MKKFGIAVISAFIGFSALVAQAGWDKQSNDQEFDGVVVFNRGIYLGGYPSGNNLLNVTAEQLRRSVSNDVRDVTQSSATITNGQAIALANYAGETVLFTTGVILATNQLSAVSSALVGKTYRFVNNGTNRISFVDAAPAYLVGGTNSAVLLDQNDSLTVYVLATNKIIQTAASDN